MLASTLIFSLCLSVYLRLHNVFRFSFSSALPENFDFCEDPKNYTLIIESLVLTPSDHIGGKNLTVELNGNFTEPVTNKSEVHLQVLLMNSVLYEKVMNLCSIDFVKPKCPIPAGQQKLTFSENIPNIHLPVLEVRVRVVENNKTVSCVDGKIHLI